MICINQGNGCLNPNPVKFEGEDVRGVLFQKIECGEEPCPGKQNSKLEEPDECNHCHNRARIEAWAQRVARAEAGPSGGVLVKREPIDVDEEAMSTGLTSELASLFTHETRSRPASKGGDKASHKATDRAKKRGPPTSIGSRQGSGDSQHSKASNGSGNDPVQFGETVFTEPLSVPAASKASSSKHKSKKQKPEDKVTKR